MTVYRHPHANKVIVSVKLDTPNPGIPQTVLVIEANIPLTEQIEGYDPAKFGSLLDFARETMSKVDAEKVEIIYPLSDQYITAQSAHCAGKA